MQRTSVLQIAAFTGAGGVSFVPCGEHRFASVAHSLFHDRRRWRLRRPESVRAVPVDVCVACTSMAFNRFAFSVVAARVAFVQPAFHRGEMGAPRQGEPIFRPLAGIHAPAADGHPNLCWPEASTLVRDDEQVCARIRIARGPRPVRRLVRPIAIENRGQSDESGRTACWS